MPAALTPLEIGRAPLAIVVLEVDQEPRALIGNPNGDSFDAACNRLDDWLSSSYPAERALLMAVLDAQAERKCTREETSCPA